MTQLMSGSSNSSLANNFKAAFLRFVLLAEGMITAAFGMVALLGWVLKIPLLASFKTGFIPMAPSTAVLFLLYGASIGCRGWFPASRRARQLSITMIGAGTAIAFLIFVSGCFNIHWPGERLGLNITGAIDGAPLGYMSPVTAFYFLLAGVSFMASQSPFVLRSWRALLSWGSAGILLTISIIFLLAYTFGAPLLYGSRFIPPAINTILAFVMLGFGLLTLAGRSAGLFGGARFANSKIAVNCILIFIFLSAGIFSAGYIYYRNYEQRYRAEAGHDLFVIAELKVSELAQWRRERMGDGEVFFNNPVFSGLVGRFLGSSSDPVARQQLQMWLGRTREYYQYDRILLFDTQAVERLTIPASSTEPADDICQYLAPVLRFGQVTFMDFHRHAPGGQIVLGVLVPVFSETSRPLGVLVLQIDPNQYLYPFLQRWPGSSKTAETLLVRREGDRVVFLNELRFQTNTALTLSHSLSITNLPAAQAALGKEGVVEGLDYRKTPVIAALKAVPDSPWYMVARKDKAEVFLPLWSRFWLVVGMISLLMFGSAAGIGLIWRHQRVRFYREQAKTAEALRETNDYLESLINYANAPIVVWDPQYRITRFNHAFERLTGRSETEVLGQSLELLFPPDQSEKSMELIRNTLAGDHWEETEIPILNSTGSIRTVLWNSASLFAADGKTLRATIAQGHDITSRKQAEEQVLRDEVRLKALVSVLQSRAETTEQLLDYALNEAIGLTESQIGYIYFYHEDRQEFVLNTWSKEVMKECEVANPQSCYELNKTGVWGEAVRQRRPIVLNDFQAENPHKKGYPKGHVALTRFMTVPVFKNDQIVAVVGVANKATDYDESDVLQLTLLMDAVWKSVDTKTAEAALKATLEQLRVSNRDLEQFAYIASHDLQEPLRMVANYMQLLERRYKDKLDQDAKDFIGYAVDGAVRMQQLVDSLLEYSRLQTRRKPFEKVDLSDVARRVLHDLEGRVLDTEAQIMIDPLPHIVGDAVQLGLVFQNFISNALKFRGENPPEVRITAEELPRHWKISVSDNGIGIEPEHYEKIFKIFQRLYSRAEYPGTGIGLAICRRIIERHNGQTGVESIIGKGSTFWFTLPKKGAM